MTATLDTIEQAPDYTGTLRRIPVGAERHYLVESSRAYLSLSTARTRLHTAGEGRYEFSMDWENNVLTVKRLA